MWNASYCLALILADMKETEFNGNWLRLVLFLRAILVLILICCIKSFFPRLFSLMEVKKTFLHSVLPNTNTAVSFWQCVPYRCTVMGLKAL